jgi:signal transduction histidine kinase
MIRKLHRRFLWNAYLWACVFLLILVLICLLSLEIYMRRSVRFTLHDLQQLSETQTGTVRSRQPAYLAEIRQATPDPEATELRPGDSIVFLYGERSGWSEQEIEFYTGEMLKGPRQVNVLRDVTLCYTVDRTSIPIRIAAVDFAGYRSLFWRIAMSAVLIHLVICGALFLVLKTLEIRQLRPAERAWANQERFVEDASHEIKTPLSVILSNAELGAGEQPEETEKRFSMILNEAQRMKLLITRMLESARIENSAAKRRKADVFALSDAVTECALLCEEPLYERGIVLHTWIEDDLYVRADEALFKQVMLSLLENAGKYTPVGRDVYVRVKKSWSHAVVSVRNEGVGLGVEERELIFERFYRADKARTHSEGSYGLGLSIVKNRIESMGGTIRCTSDGSTYTAFILTIRLARKNRK